MKNDKKPFFPDKPWLPDPAEWRGTWREDWRITGQEGYLKGKELFLKEISDCTTVLGKRIPQCSFCFSIIEKGDNAYYEPINDIWVCRKCFEDFNGHFDWTVTENKKMSE